MFGSGLLVRCYSMIECRVSNSLVIKSATTIKISTLTTRRISRSNGKALIKASIALGFLYGDELIPEV